MVDSSKVSIITIGTWYKALWSPNLTWNHNKKVFHLFFWNFSFQKLHTHLFSGSDRNRPTKANKNSKVVKIYFFKQKVIKMYFFNQKMVEHQNIPISFNFSDPGAYITYLMLLYLPCFYPCVAQKVGGPDTLALKVTTPLLTITCYGETFSIFRWILKS